MIANAFTSRKRISDYLKEPENCLGVAASNLFKMLFNSKLSAQSAVPLPADEIALLMSGSIYEVLSRTR